MDYQLVLTIVLSILTFGLGWIASDKVMVFLRGLIKGAHRRK